MRVTENDACNDVTLCTVHRLILRGIRMTILLRFYTFLPYTDIYIFYIYNYILYIYTYIDIISIFILISTSIIYIYSYIIYIYLRTCMYTLCMYIHINF